MRSKEGWISNPEGSFSASFPPHAVSLFLHPSIQCQLQLELVSMSANRDESDQFCSTFQAMYPSPVLFGPEVCPTNQLYPGMEGKWDPMFQNLPLQTIGAESREYFMFRTMVWVRMQNKTHLYDGWVEGKSTECKTWTTNYLSLSGTDLRFF